ncbi:hypothetical protein QTO34_016637 [Cnephaeus nilssonii]|uniref:Uncharacterized protein n=1 Tax=Cnephaeus nilssonii TaxID=3371016 RepID=A0AA40I3B6_CNENI|nr:hypothetical protein QTO34_016637 [Eptesicus nilssonii]
MPRIVATTSQGAVAVLVAAELHHRHTFTKRAMIPAGTRTGPGRKGKMEVSKHSRSCLKAKFDETAQKQTMNTGCEGLGSLFFTSNETQTAAHGFFIWPGTPSFQLCSVES